MSLTKGFDINTNQSIMLLLLEAGFERMHPFGDQSLTFSQHIPMGSFSTLWGLKSRGSVLKQFSILHFLAVVLILINNFCCKAFFY